MSWLPLRRLWRDARGINSAEFAIVAPAMLGMIMGFGDVLYQSYATAMLTGALQKAGRDSAIQGGAQQADVIDGKVIAMLGLIMANATKACPTTAGTSATWCATRKSYSTFSQAAPEPFTDGNSNGIRDAGECYSDVNGNGAWDVDPGSTGQGGANDVTLYSMTVTYPRLFPVAGLFGRANTVTISAKTILKNQPYATQTVRTVNTICT